MKPAHTVRKATKAREAVKHTKTFSGCWTCRDRHVKCDEARPHCARCIKGGFQCQGYGIKLVWIDPNSQEREQNIRRVIGTPAVYDDGSNFMRVDVNEALEVIEGLLPGEGYVSSGPFSVFSLQTAEAEQLEPSFESDLQTLPIYERRDSTLPTDLSEEDVDDPGDELIETIISPSTTYLQGSAYTPDTPTQWPSSPALPLTIRHLDLLPRPAEQRDLIHHWTNFVCWHLVPVDRPDNPFRSVFTPMALAGLSSPSNQSNGQIALFHALCATSAFSRGQLLHGDSRNLTLAMKHYNLAIMHLRHSLVNLKDNDENLGQVHLHRGSILATITMFSAMDMITGRAGEWRTHLQGGASWLSTIENSEWNRDKSSSMVYQGYLAIAALCNINLPSTIDVESESFLGDERNYVLDRFFGLTRPILKHIVVMNSLTNRISTTASEPPTTAMLDDLETQLYAQTPSNLDLSGLPPLAQFLTLHHAYVFYYASLIYFLRTVRRLSPQAACIQTMVSKAVTHLEDIESLGGDSIGCTLVWPPFIVACECLSEEMQERMLSWYRLKRRHGFMNLEISKDIARELWRRRQYADDRGTADVDIQWQDVLREMKMDIVLA
ncbi:arginine metabolism regulation protein II [Fonsecaea pedrosoi]|nr:arginine metabolism regulation protein II [Fonsecaea pedrosoi]